MEVGADWRTGKGFINARNAWLVLNTSENGLSDSDFCCFRPLIEGKL
jgi:hypothetical protein